MRKARVVVSSPDAGSWFSLLQAVVRLAVSQGSHSNCIFKFPVYLLCVTANFPCANLRHSLLLHTQN